MVSTLPTGAPVTDTFVPLSLGYTRKVSNDVEKRWNDPQAFRAAVKYVLFVIALAVLAVVATSVWAYTNADLCRDAEFFVCQEPERTLFLVAPPAILLLGGLGAFYKTYRVWRAGGVWPIWQGAGWALFVLMLVYITGSVGVLSNPGG